MTIVIDILPPKHISKNGKKKVQGFWRTSELNLGQINTFAECCPSFKAP